MGSTRRTVVGALLGCAGLAGTAYATYRILNAYKTEEPAADPSLPEESVSVLEIFLHYQKNAAEADERFKGKYIRVAGRVGLISNDLSGATCVTLSEADGGNVANVRCLFSGRERDKLGGVHQGDIAEIIGRCGGWGEAIVLLENCRLE